MSLAPTVFVSDSRTGRVWGFQLVPCLLWASVPSPAPGAGARVELCAEGPCFLFLLTLIFQAVRKDKFGCFQVCGHTWGNSASCHEEEGSFL